MGIEWSEVGGIVELLGDAQAHQHGRIYSVVKLRGDDGQLVSFNRVQALTQVNAALHVGHRVRLLLFKAKGLPGAVADLVLTGEAAAAARAAAGSSNAAQVAQAVQQNVSQESLQQLAQLYEPLRRAADTFNTNVNAAAAQMARAVNSQDSQRFVQRARALGWASAGALNATLLRAAARSAELASDAAPTMTGPDLTVLSRAFPRRNQPTEARMRLEAAITILSGIVTDVNPSTAAPASAVTLGADRQSMALVTRLFKPMTDGIARMLTDDVAYIDPVRPMSSIQSMGNALLGLAWTPVLVFAGAKMAAGAGAAMPLGLGAIGGGAAGGLDALGPMVYTLTFAAFVAGALHAYVLPMLPFLMWTYAILAVVSLAAELIVAAPAAAFMHIRADGQELINQEQRTIWVMVFNALMRPSLLLCGLVIANLAFSVMANYLNKLYGPAVSAVNGDSLIGIIGFIVLTVLIFYLHYQLVVRCMQLISQIPAAVSDIVGAKDQDRGEHGETNRVFGAIANISARGGTAAQGAVANVLKNDQDRRQAASIRNPQGGSTTGQMAERQGGGEGGGNSIRPATGGGTPQDGG